MVSLTLGLPSQIVCDVTTQLRADPQAQAASRFMQHSDNTILSYPLSSHPALLNLPSLHSRPHILAGPPAFLPLEIARIGSVLPLPGAPPSFIQGSLPSASLRIHTWDTRGPNEHIQQSSDITRSSSRAAAR